MADHGRDDDVLRWVLKKAYGIRNPSPDQLRNYQRWPARPAVVQCDARTRRCSGSAQCCVRRSPMTLSPRARSLSHSPKRAAPGKARPPTRSVALPGGAAVDSGLGVVVLVAGNIGITTIIIPIRAPERPQTAPAGPS